MEEVVLVIHLFLAISIIGLVLLQRSEGGGLGIGGGGGGLGGVATPQGTASFMTKATTFCAIAFFCTSLLLGVLAGQHSAGNQSILDALEETPAAAIQDVQDITINDDGTANKTEPPSAPIAE